MQLTHTDTLPPAVSGARLWTGRVITGLMVAFLLFDGITKIMKVPQVLEAQTRLGYPQSAVVKIGIIVLLCTVLYVIPRTAVFGAMLLTAYLGGAVASQVRISAPAVDTSFPIIFCVLVWAALFLRDPRLRQQIASGVNPITQVKEFRDAVLNTAMEEGAAETFDRLAELLATPPAGPGA